MKFLRTDTDTRQLRPKDFHSEVSASTQGPKYQCMSSCDVERGQKGPRGAAGALSAEIVCEAITSQLGNLRFVLEGLVRLHNGDIIRFRLNIKDSERQILREPNREHPVPSECMSITTYHFHVLIFFIDGFNVELLLWPLPHRICQRIVCLFHTR